MKMGHIDVSIIKILIVGAGGAGKSCFLKFLCNLPIPDEHNSTGCIEAAQRVKCERIRTSKDDSSDEVKWELVGPDKLKAVLADAIKSRAANLTPHNEKMLSLSTDTENNEDSLQNSVTEHTQDNLLESVIEVVGLIGYKGGELFSVTWIYLVDSGGQPQFHELLTAFVRNATLGIFVFNLSEQLDDKPMIKYYKHGKPCGESYSFPLSHKEIFQHCIQTILSLDHSLSTTDTEEPTKSGILIVGTHRNQEDEFKESREDKEKKLEEILQPYSGVITNDGKYIFPVDSITRNEPDIKVVDKIRKGITKSVKPFYKKSLPLQYFALELELELQAKKEKRDIISLEECLKIGSSLKFNRESCLAALHHLDSVNLILYFERHAPNVIFVNPNILLDKVGEIVEKSYIWRRKVPSNEDQWVSKKSITPFIERGEVTLEILKYFKSGYVKGFDHTHLARILTCLFVLVPISKEVYFMPALLEVKLEKDLASPTTDYFVICFPDCVPMGLFSSSVTYLLSENNSKPCQWKISNKSGKLFRNYFSFDVDIACVTLIDRRTQFDVHIETNCKEDLAVIREYTCCSNARCFKSSKNYSPL